MLEIANKNDAIMQRFRQLIAIVALKITPIKLKEAAYNLFA